MAFLMYEQFAVDALESLPTKTPDTIGADCTESSLEDKRQNIQHLHHEQTDTKHKIHND